MSKPSVLLIGAGYVGGTVLQLLLEEGYPVSVLFRNPQQEKTLKDLGVKPIKASLDDFDAIEKATAEHDVLINTASSDHPRSVEAAINGIQRRVDQGKKSTYIHTSGTGVITDTASGRFASEKVYDDEEPDVMESLDDGAPHRAIDKNLAQKAAGWRQSGLVEVRIIVPPLIYGEGTGPFKKHSIQIPSIIGASLKQKQAVVHGPGLSVWNNVHVQDLARGYVTLLQALLEGNLKLRSDTDAFVFAESDQHKWLDISKRIAEELYKRGVIKSQEVKELTDEEVKNLGLLIPKEAWGLKSDYQQVGSNSRSRAWKLRQLGWKPKSSTKDLLDSIGSDVEIVLADEEGAVNQPGVSK